MTFAIEQSKAIHELVGEKMKPGDSYTNVSFLVTASLPDVFPDSTKLEVLFCYAPHATNSNDLVYMKHCFCLYDGAVVDPFLVDKAEEYPFEKIIPIRRLAVQEYYDLITEDKVYDLSISLLEDEVTTYMENQLGSSLHINDIKFLVDRATQYLPSEKVVTLLTAATGKPA